jgi:hypothetical protein
VSIRNGSYRPNVKGATSWRTARPLYVGNDAVSVDVYPWEGGHWMTIFIGCSHKAFEGPMPASIESHDDFYAFIHESVEAFAAAAENSPEEVEDSAGCDVPFCILDRGHVATLEQSEDRHIDATGTVFTRSGEIIHTYHDALTD